MLREQDEHRDSLARAVELAEAADQAGFDACYFPEHHGRDDDYPSAPLTLAAYVAQPDAAHRDRHRRRPAAAAQPAGLRRTDEHSRRARG
ncbi:LLM class flavin-dependent oxidoreductase [Nonomuraea ferruginea]